MSGKPKYHVVSFSGGKDSTAMLLRMIEEGWQIDEILCCDTGLEFPAMYEHIDKVEAYIGRPITRLHGSMSFEYILCDKTCQRRKIDKTNGGAKRTYKMVSNGHGWPRPLKRWCTRHLKIDVLHQHFKALEKEFDVIQYVGLAADEAYRLERGNNQDPNHRHPLVKWGMTEADCIKYCYDRGFDFGGLYKYMKRASCWLCPMQSNDELKVLHDHFPELWQRLKELEHRANGTFKEDYVTTYALEARFTAIEELAAEGITKDAPEYKKALREKLIAKGYGTTEQRKERYREDYGDRFKTPQRDQTV